MPQNKKTKHTNIKTKTNVSSKDSLSNFEKIQFMQFEYESQKNR